MMTGSLFLALVPTDTGLRYLLVFRAFPFNDERSTQLICSFCSRLFCRPAVQPSSRLAVLPLPLLLLLLLRRWFRGAVLVPLHLILILRKTHG